MDSSGEEPKAPDKNNALSLVSNNENDFKDKYKAVDNDSDKTRLNTGQDSTVSSLDETGLKALLDEAIAYRTPNDVQGKSDLFKELLHCAENEKQFSAIERPDKNNRKLRRRQALVTKKDCEKTNTHGSLQDLAHVHNLVSNQNDFNKSHSKMNIKPRVPTWKSGSNDTNTIPYKEDDFPPIVNNGGFTTFSNFNKLQQFIANETHVYTVTQENVKRAPFTAPEKRKHDENGAEEIEEFKNVIKTITDEKEKHIAIGEQLNKDGIVAKEVDENGNAVGNNVDFKRKRRLKAKNDKNTILSQHIEGHRSDIAQDIDALMNYIESSNRQENEKRGRQMNFGKSTGQILNKFHPRDKSSETVRKGRKCKDNQFKKSNSLEEVSVSKFEDLTESDVQIHQDLSEKFPLLTIANKSDFDKGETKVASKVESPSESDKMVTNSDVISTDQALNAKEDIELQNAEFHTVTKKHKKKKNLFFINRNRSSRDHNIGSKQANTHDNVYKTFYSHENKQRGGLYSFKRKPDFHRRKSTSSVPSSDKSGGESSDLDSVHSLPVTTTKVQRNELCSEGNSTHTSYADIAKSVQSPARLQNDYISDFSYKPPSDEDKKKETLEPNDTVLSVMVPLPKKREHNSFNLNYSSCDYPPLNATDQVQSFNIPRLQKNQNQVVLNSNNADIGNDQRVLLTTPSENKSNTDDMFVEYTFVAPHKDKVVNNCVDVEETVYVKLKTSENVTPAPLPQTSVEETVMKRPPVILMSETKEMPIVNDIEFGFEINQQLLQGVDDQMITEEKPPKPDDTDVKQCEDNYQRNVVKATIDGDLNSIVRYVSADWDYIMSGLAGEVKYYSE